MREQIRDGKLLTFRDVTALNAAEFYGDASSAAPTSHYPQAHYLCFYLQEKGLLRKFYTAFFAHASENSTGYATLQRELGESDMDVFLARWREFVLGLKLAQP